MATQELSISKNYVPTWGLVEGVRELFQNAIDQQAMTNGVNKMSWTYANEKLMISNANSVLTRDTLLFGSTSKDGKGSIGQFGEGYKLALLVLTRLGKKVTIYNNSLNEIWTARFKTSRKLNNVEMLVIDMDSKLWSRSSDNDLDIVIEDITSEEYAELRKYNLHLQKPAKETIETEYGVLLRDKKYAGHIYLGGLFVAKNEELHYGYNFNPGVLTLNRDRDMIWDWDLYSATSKVLRHCPSLMIARAVKSEYIDAKYLTANDWRDDNTTEAAKVVAQEIKEEFGDNVTVVTNQADANTLKAIHGASLNVAVVPEQIYKYCVASKSMTPLPEIDEEGQTMVDKVLNWIQLYSEVIPDRAQEELLEILTTED